jgi:hypothetical protein
MRAPQADLASLYRRNLSSPSRNGPFCARIAQLQGLFSPRGAICPCWPAASCVRRSAYCRTAGGSGERIKIDKSR